MGLFEERICADNPKTIKELKTAIPISKLDHLLSPMVAGAIADSKIARLPEVTLRKRAQKRSFTLSAADG